ncbi:MAG: hypothetical protein AB1631_06065 [Acidobacteriota bacterium]
MPERKGPRKLSAANTKQEMLAAYNDLLKQLEEKRESDLKPEQKIEEKEVKRAVEVADSLSTEGIVREAGNLKAEVGRALAQLSDKLEEQIARYEEIKKAVEAKENELQEIYEIQKAASSLAALIEAQHLRRESFEEEMASRKEELEREIQSTRAEWEKEKKAHEAEKKERDTAEQRRREREKEEYLYGFNREQQLAKDKFEDEKARLEREIVLQREQMEREIAERERVVAQKEEELAELKKRVEAYPKEMEAAVSKAVKDAVQSAQAEAKNKEELIKKEFTGERNVLTTRIESLESTVKEQNEQISKLSQQLEKAYAQIQEIALKTIEGASASKSLESLQQFITESRKQSQEK